MKKRYLRKRSYDMAMSFAGEDRDIVEKVSDYLDLFGVRIFYDNWELHKLIGENLYTYLADVFEKKASYCIMFISKAYIAKAWPRHERKFAQARDFSSRKPYILPIRLDRSECPGIPKTIGYIDGKKHKPIEIAILLLKRLGRELYSGDADDFFLERFMTWRIFWNGSVQARGRFQLVYLGRLSKRRITFNIWSPDGRPLKLIDCAVTTGRKKLDTNISTTIKTAKQCNTSLKSPVKFGDVLNYEVRYKCLDYYSDISKRCKDDFNAGAHMLSWDYKFIFPRNSILKSFKLVRRIGRNQYLQSYDSSIENQCPIINYSFLRPKVGSKLELEFQIERP